MWKPLKLLPWFIAAGAAWTAGYFFNTYYGGGISWLRHTYENKIARAAEIKAPHRLLLVGGSGVHYSPNTQVLEKELGIPAFNLGLDGNLGLNVILPTVLKEVQPGDIVLLIPEYLMLLDEDGHGERSVAFSLAIGNPGLAWQSPKQFAEETWLVGLPTLKSLTKSSLDLIEKGSVDDYYTDPITNWGDPTKTFDRQGKWWKMEVEKPISPYSIQAITKFRDQVKAKGATLVLSISWIYAKTDSQTVANVQKTIAELSKIAPTVYDPKSLNLKTDSSLFADTHYHLLPEIRIIRSQQLAQQLKPVLKEIEKQKSTKEN
jgi:hypothetical protein